MTPKDLKKLLDAATPGPIGYVGSDLGVIIQQGPFEGGARPGTQVGIEWIADAKVSECGNDSAIAFKNYADLDLWMKLRNIAPLLLELWQGSENSHPIGHAYTCAKHAHEATRECNCGHDEIGRTLRALRETNT